MKKRFYSALVAIVAAIAIGGVSTSCIEGVENTVYLQGYFTITGDLTNGYTLYQDGGGVIKPNTNSVLSLAGEKGFENNERAYFAFSYTESDVKDYEEGSMLSNAKLVSGYYLNTVKPITVTEATEKKINDNDSIFPINKMNYAWAYRGYLNTLINANPAVVNEKTVNPDVNIVYDPDKMENDKLDLTIVYNRHAPQYANTGTYLEFVCSYPIYELASLVPGSKDSIDVTLTTRGIDPVSFKIGRNDLKKGNYKPYTK